MSAVEGYQVFEELDGRSHPMVMDTRTVPPCLTWAENEDRAAMFANREQAQALINATYRRFYAGQDNRVYPDPHLLTIRTVRRDGQVTEHRFTVWCCEVGGGGTTWIDEVWAADADEARDNARVQCAADWSFEPDKVTCVGVAEGQVNILFWYDPDT